MSTSAAGDVEVGDGAEPPGAERADRYPPLREGFGDLLRGSPGRLLDLEVDDVGLDRIEVELQPGNARHPLGETAGVAVVVGEAVDVVIEGVDPGRGEDAGLAHRSAETLLPAPDLAEPPP